MPFPHPPLLVRQARPRWPRWLVIAATGLALAVPSAASAALPPSTPNSAAGGNRVVTSSGILFYRKTGTRLGRDVRQFAPGRLRPGGAGEGLQRLAGAATAVTTSPTHDRFAPVSGVPTCSYSGSRAAASPARLSRKWGVCETAGSAGEAEERGWADATPCPLPL